MTQARCRAASTIGMISTSGGIGKIELSMNETAASAQSAPGRADSDSVQS